MGRDGVVFDDGDVGLQGSVHVVVAGVDGVVVGVVSCGGHREGFLKRLLVMRRSCVMRCSRVVCGDVVGVVGVVVVVIRCGGVGVVVEVVVGGDGGGGSVVVVKHGGGGVVVVVYVGGEVVVIVGGDLLLVVVAGGDLLLMVVAAHFHLCGCVAAARRGNLAARVMAGAIDLQLFCLGLWLWLRS